MDRSRKFCYLIAALTLAGMISVACDSGTQEPAAPEKGTPLTATDSNADAADLPKEQIEGIPEAFPDEFPIYPGSSTSQGKGTLVDGVPMAAVQLSTTDSPKEVYDFYMDKLVREGWTIETRAGLEDKDAVSAKKGKCTATMLAAPTEEGSTSIFLITEC